MTHAKLLRLLADKRGSTAVEYLILICLIALLGFAAWRGFGGSISEELAAAGEDVGRIRLSEDAARRRDSVRILAMGAPSKTAAAGTVDHAARNFRLGAVPAALGGTATVDAESETACLVTSRERSFESLRRCTVVEILLEAGASPTSRADAGDSAVFLAAKSGEPRMVELLIQRDADVDVPSEVGSTALMVACTADVARILLKAGADPNATMQGDTDALMCAAQEGAEEVVAELLEAGADVGRANDKQTTALMLAAMNGQAQVVRRLIDAGAPRDTKAINGATALSLAEKAGAADVVALLRG